jgi:hypothetical protein
VIKIQLELVEVLQGSFNLVFVVISLIVGIKIILKYFKYKNFHLILAGLVWIGISTPWMPGALTFLSIILFNTLLSTEIRFMIGNAFIPIIIVMWLKICDDLVFKDKKNLVTIIALIFSIIFEIVFFIFLFTDTALIGTYYGTFRVRWSIFIQIFLMSVIVAGLISGILFAKESLNSENPEIRLKGKFILLAWIAFSSASFFDVINPINPISIIIVRIVLSFSALAFYLGWFLPSPVKNMILKE